MTDFVHGQVAFRTVFFLLLFSLIVSIFTSSILALWLVWQVLFTGSLLSLQLKTSFNFRFSCAKSFLSCQFPENQWLCNTPRLFNLSQRYFLQNMSKLNFKVCLRNVKSAWQAVRWSRRSRLSRGFDFSAPRRLFRVLREPKENIRLFCENPRG